jgi:hypothetical protein
VIPGVTITMGDADWVVPPLTLGQLRRLMPQLQQLGDVGGAMAEPQIAVLVDIVAAALQRNYPQLTAGAVEELLDLGNAAPVLAAVLTGSGLQPGEAAAVAGSTGPTSTGFSPPPAATASR